jgi:hypothetical protein
MAYRFGRMPFTPEMNSFNTEIGSNQRLMTSGDLQDGAVIANACRYLSTAASPASNARDQQFFGERQDESIY